MPITWRNGAEIDYEVRGEGTPLVLIEGLGYGRWMWRGQSPALDGRFRLILPDNRGVGRSTPLPGPYSIPEFAHDVLAVLDAEGIQRTAVLGASMGGLIAQSLAAIAPERVSALVLACTLAGGPEARPMPPETFAEVTRQVPGESERDRILRTMAVAMTAAFPRDHPEVVDAILADRLASPTDPAQWMFQALSSRDFDASASDAGLDVPVLITTGTEDRVVPWTNSIQLYRLCPRASLVLFRGQNHLHLIERSAEFNEVVTRFCGTTPSTLPPRRIEEVG